MKTPRFDPFIVGILVLTFAVIVIGILVIPASDSPQVDSADMSTVLSLVDDDIIFGKDESDITLIEYLDFECEACAAYYPVLKRIKEEYKGDISFVVRYFPLSGHRNSKFAAQAAEAANRQGLFWNMHDKLFENQLEWSGKNNYFDLFLQYAEEIGLNIERFKADYEDSAIKDRISRDYSAGETIGVDSTPTFFLNEKKLSGVRTVEQFRDILNKELSITD